MSCVDGCGAVTPSQAHCPACHVTFGGVRGFDLHRNDGICRTPVEIGMVSDGKGVWRTPMDDAAIERLKQLKR